MKTVLGNMSLLRNLIHDRKPSEKKCYMMLFKLLEVTPPLPQTTPPLTASPPILSLIFKSWICFFIFNSMKLNIIYNIQFYWMENGGKGSRYTYMYNDSLINRRFPIPPFFCQSRERRYSGVDCTNHCDWIDHGHIIWNKIFSSSLDSWALFVKCEGYHWRPLIPFKWSVIHQF